LPLFYRQLIFPNQFGSDPKLFAENGQLVRVWELAGDGLGFALALAGEAGL